LHKTIFSSKAAGRLVVVLVVVSEMTAASWSFFVLFANFDGDDDDDDLFPDPGVIKTVHVLPSLRKNENLQYVSDFNKTYVEPSYFNPIRWVT
jgi:hypothetical protein